MQSVLFLQIFLHFLFSMAIEAGLYYNAAMLSGAISATPVGVGLALTGASLGGLAIGIAAATYAEIKLQEFEEKCKRGSFKVRWQTAQGIRFLIFGGGVAMTTTAALGIISASIAVTASVASCGVGLAIVGVLALGYGFARYKMLSAAMQQREREEAAVEMVNIMLHDPHANQELRSFARDHGVTMREISKALEVQHNDEVAAVLFVRARKLLRSLNEVSVEV